jgi:Tol biopolymer transport system component
MLNNYCPSVKLQMSKLFKIYTLLLLIVANICYTDTAESHGAVSSEKGSIVYTSPSGVTEVLTKTGVDDAPILSPDGKLIAFTRVVRQGNDQQLDDQPVRDLWVINVDSHKSTRLVAGKPEATERPEQTLADIDQPVFSPDGTTIYFMTAAWVTSAAIHAVPAAGGKQRFITNGNSLAIIRRGKYKGALLVDSTDTKARKVRGIRKC